MKPTNYTDVNKVLRLLTAGLQKTLGSKLVALYLTGSLSYGDFDYGSSDIDFLAVLTQELDDNELQAIKEMHDSISKKVPYWAKRLEGSYIPQSWLESIERPQGKRPYVNAGIIYSFTYGNEWLLNLYVLYECGITLLGKSPKQLIQPVDIEAVREASRKNLIEEWGPKSNEKDPFTHTGYDSSHLQAYAILTMCRILHREKIDNVASKRGASSWVKANYKQWANLIEEAENWKHGVKIDKKEETKAFIKFVLSEVNNTAKSGLY